MTEHSLSDRINQGYADAWMPKPGQNLIGEVVEISSGSSEWGPYPIVTLAGPEGKRLAVHAFHTVLKNGLIEAKPQIGETVAIKYEGEKLGKNGKKGEEYHVYRVIVDRKPADVWGMFTPEHN